MFEDGDDKIRRLPVLLWLQLLHGLAMQLHRSGFGSEISRIHLETLHAKAFSVCLSNPQPINFLLVECRKHVLQAALKKAQKKMKKINRKWLGALADAKEISVHAAAEAVLSEPGGIWTLKEQRAAQRAYLGGEDVFSFLLTGFGKSLIKLHNTSQFTTGRWHAANFTNTRQELLLPGSTESKNKNNNEPVLPTAFYGL